MYSIYHIHMDRVQSMTCDCRLVVVAVLVYVSNAPVLHASALVV